MKSNIHPAYFSDVTVTCSSCGNKFVTGSTKKDFNVDVCSSCHPFYTGDHRLLDVKGRVDTFQKKMEQAKKYQSMNTSKKDKAKKEQKTGKTLRELLNEV